MTGGAALQAQVVVSRGGFRLDASVEAAPGEVVAVMGPSGAGKSTLLGAIAGSVRLTSGEVRVGDAVLTRRSGGDPRRRGVVLLGQDPLLFPHLTVRDNIAFGMRVRGVSRSHARAQADDWLWRVDLAGHGDKRPRQLSGGQAQRVGVARALATGPRLLLLDEPLARLDVETASDIRSLIAEQLTSTHTTAVVVTHDAFDAAALSSRMVVLEGGSVTQRGDVRHVLARPATRFVAAAAGLNRLRGIAAQGVWTGESFGVSIEIASAEPGPRAADGDPLVAVFRPADVALARAGADTWTGAIRVARSEPGPERGTWLARVERLEPAPGGARVHVTQPALAVDVPTAQMAALGLRRGDPVRVSIRPEHVRLIPAMA